MNDTASALGSTVLRETRSQVDAIVQKIFTVMTASACFPVDACPQAAPDLHARIVFLHSSCKTCEITLTHEDADELIRLLTGSEETELREDVAGELCNMIAGGWKARKSKEGLSISMSSPRVRTHQSANFCDGCSACFCGTYSFGTAQFTVHLRFAETH